MSTGPTTNPSTTGRAAALSSCPQCGAKGSKVGSITLRSLLSAEAHKQLDGRDTFFFCKTKMCEVVYFDAQRSKQFRDADLTVPVFQKSADPSCPVCYCFGYTVNDVRDDALRTGTASIADDITEKCRQGLDRCEETNPQGVCCLGNVRQVAKAACADAGTAPRTRETSTGELLDCCWTKQRGAAARGDDHE